VRQRLVRVLVCVLTAVSLASVAPTRARALDILPGGETLFQQVEGADIVLSARYIGRSTESLIFERDALLAGSVGSRVAVASDDYLATLELTPGAAYVLCLRSEPDGTLRARASMYSVLAVPSAELPAALAAVRVYLRDRTDRARLTASLLQLAASDSALLQTGAVTSLSQRGLLTRENVVSLLELARTNRLREPRAREQVLEQAGWLRAATARSVVESRLLDPTEDASVREAALRALHRIDPRSVERVLPQLRGPSAPRLQQGARSLQERTTGR
jgi:hypothetical protein